MYTVSERMAETSFGSLVESKEFTVSLPKYRFFLQKITLLALNNPEIDVIFDRKLLFPDTFAGLSIELPLKVYNNSDVPVS